jgi:hypothetical protein
VTRTEAWGLSVGFGAGAVVFFAGSSMWPEASLEWFGAAAVTTFAAIVALQVHSDGWRETGWNFIEAAVMSVVGAGFCFLLRAALLWLRG